MSKKTRILLAEQSTEFKNSLKSLLNGQEEFQLIGESNSAAKALALVAALKPDIIFLDIGLTPVRCSEVREGS